MKPPVVLSRGVMCRRGWLGPVLRHSGRQMLRYNPKTDHWAAYQMPEPYSYNRRTVIDTSTKPATVWYVDYNNYLVRVQPLD